MGKYKETALSAGKEVALYLRNNPETFNKLTDIWGENSRRSDQIKALQINNEMQMRQIAMRYQMFRDTLTAVFSERSTALVAHYKALDRALETNDREVVIASLQGISTIVSQNPLESFEAFSRTLDDDNEVLKLDF
jgi:hypothetical protein